ncbi:MAG: cardiolipin synthase [Acholeplasmataceae bacterium]
MKRLLRLLLSRTALILLLVFFQILLFLFLIAYIARFEFISTFLYVLSVIIALYLIAKEENPIYKLSWIVPILVFPLFGGLFYLFYRQRNVNPKMLEHMRTITSDRFRYIELIPLKQDRNATYLERFGYASYRRTRSTFIPNGESFYEQLIEDIRNAKMYIFLEFFIISKSQIWNRILRVLQERVRAGVEVRIIYDDFGSYSLPFRYPKKLRAEGFRVINFNPIRLHINFIYNYRDHRKVVVIDGNIGYTGGMNIGDEYMNVVHPFGHWRDAMVRLEGDAVWSLALTFIQNWRFQSKEEIDYERYRGSVTHESSGLVIPFDDMPLDQELTTKNIYLSLISNAEESILITTPYLIIDSELTTALTNAAKSGIDVRIIIPFVPDKRFVLMVTESFIPELIESGVKIYRYKPGFIHSKMLIADRKKALFGTANFDFRSLYLHFENSIYYDSDPVIADMLRYYQETEAESVLAETLKKRNILYRLVQTLLRGFAPLL